MGCMSRLCASLVGKVLIVLGASTLAFAQTSPLRVTEGGTTAHIFPSVAHHAALASALSDPGPLLYNGGPVMTSAKAYAIFWIPATLQDGTPNPGLTAHYQAVQKSLLGDYPGHTLGSNNTQYYMKSGTTTTYIKDTGSLGGYYVDTNPYPASGCTDSVTNTNCLTDMQLQTEIQNVMTLKNWQGGLGNIFFVFTSQGEGSCFDGTGTTCAYTQYCAYHGAFTNTSTNQVVIYGNEPFADTSYCQVPGTPNPTGDKNADAEANVLSHELTEAITDPELNAWFSAAGNEIGDLCAWTFGANTWKSGGANQSWNGRFYELQLEYDNHVQGCVQLGP